MIDKRRVALLLPVLAGLLLLPPLAACSSAETVELDGAGGQKIALEIHLPPGFDAGTAYSVLVSPGEYYWKERPSQPGWIVAVSDAFWGDARLANSKLALAWLRQHYEPRNGGFHIAGWSANSAGVFEIAMAYPQEFLSVTGIAGMPGRGSEADLGKLAGTRVQFVVGEKDSYWRRGSERWFEQMEQIGIEATLEIISEGEHVMPEIANEPIFERLDRLVASIEAAG